MKSLQTQYNLIKEGKGNKEIFVKSAKAQFPTIPNHYGFNETVNELKHKNILNETMLGIVSAQPTTPDWFKIFNENTQDPDQEYAFSNKELTAKSSTTNKSIMDIYNMLSEIDDIDFIQEIGIIISRKDWDNRVQFANKQRIYKEIQKHLNDKNIIDDLEEELYQQIKKSSSKLNEAKAEEKKPTKEVVDMETRGFDYKDKKNIDNVYGEEFLKGFYTEMNDPKNEDKTVEELKSIVAKNLAKDQLHYVKDGQFGTKGIGYTTEHPGLGTPKEAKGKYKSSGYGDLKENQSTRSVGPIVKPEDFQVGDKVKFRGMNHEITRIVDDRIYIKSLRYGRRPEVWVKAVDLKKSSLKENKSNPEVDKLLKVMNTKKAGSEYKKALMDLIAMAEKKSNKTINTKKEALLALDYIEPTIKENENTLMDIENQLLDANIGDMAYGGGYGPFEKVTRNTWKNTKTGSLQHSRKLTEFIGGFSDFRISSSTSESKLRSAIHQFIKEELNRGKL
jgi:hypothetical protein